MDAAFDHPAAGLDPLERSILSTVLYFDVFGHPLTAEEIARYSPSKGLTADMVRSLCRRTPLCDRIREEGRYYMVRTSAGDLAARRHDRESAATRLWTIARLMGRIVAAVPFVRSVYVSGELSKGVAGPDSDIDLVIVTEERRLWIVRTVLVAFKRIVLLGRRRYLCFNHLQTIGHLETPSKSYYDAIEVASLRLVGGEPVMDRFLEANPWIAAMLPNATVPASERSFNGRVPRRRLTWPILTGLADRLDATLREFWERAWVRRYPHLTPEERRRRFACTPFLSTAYGSDSWEPIMASWRARLASHGLSPIEAAAA